MDHIIREAADKHHPAYNDKAWEMMEKKLDKHLPQKKDRRKFIFFLLFFLLLGSGALFTVVKFTSENNSASSPVTEKNTIPQTGDEKIIAQNITKEDADQENIPKKNDEALLAPTSAGNSNLVKNEQAKNNTRSAESFEMSTRRSMQAKRRLNTNITAAITGEESVMVSEKEDRKKKKNTPAQKNTGDKTNMVITAASPENDETENAVTETLRIDQDKKSTEEQNKESVKLPEEKKEKEKIVAELKPKPAVEKKKSGKNIAGNFGLTFSAGPDLSFVKVNKLGKATLMYGAGLSYVISKRFSVRAGFYVSKKLYTAAPNEYHFPGGAYYPYLTGVAADCKVYEIPVSFSYSFGQRKKHSWFGNIGLSSVLMKTEDYEYMYKVPSGQTYNYYRKVSNENNHYFSTVTVSGGYQYNLSKRLSITAEPYVKLPLSGIGLGKIKLNSSGVLFTVTLKPFAKK